MANALQPNLTVLLGDYVWHELEAIFDLAPVLAGLNARHGVFAATGNHDYWTDIKVISAAMKEVGLLYTNRGLGVTSEPVRFNCSPEITEITLVRA